MGNNQIGYLGEKYELHHQYYVLLAYLWITMALYLYEDYVNENVNMPLSTLLCPCM